MPCLGSLTVRHCPGAGIGLYPLGALANHSCKPSAVQVFRGRTMQIRALEDLESGQEVRLHPQFPTAVEAEGVMAR